MAEHAEEQAQIQSNSEPVVVIEHLVKQFGKLRAIDDLTMTINTGETFGLIGPNGSGKTTLIRILVGLARPSSGVIRVLHERVPNSRVLAQTGYMTQLSALYTDLTARENLQFFCSIYGLHGKEQGQRIQEILERVDLADRANDVVSKFSGGMKQRLSLACALVHHPRLVFLDEPTVGVDPELRRSFWDYFAVEHRRRHHHRLHTSSRRSRTLQPSGLVALRQATGARHTTSVIASIRQGQHGRCVSPFRQSAGGAGMNFTRILALANRIIRQVVRDKRTLALIFIVPIVVMTLLYLVLTGTSNVHTLALVRPTGTGSDRVNTLINSLVPAQ